MKRQVTEHLLNYFRNTARPYNVLLIQGARQVGKTYLIESVLRDIDHTAINLEKQPEVCLAIDDTKTFVEFERRLEQYTGFKPNQNKVLYIDEAQESERLGSYVRHFKEDWQDTKVVLSGSSMNRLFRDDQRVPVGRIEYLTVYPFSFREYLRFIDQERLLDLSREDFFNETADPRLHADILDHYDRFLHVGGMPEAVKESANSDRYERVHQMILASQRDDFMRKESVDSHLFIDAFRALSHHIGDISHYAHIPTTHHKAKRVIELLKAWYIVIEVPQLGSIPSQKFSPKRYLYDIGILRSYRELAVPKISLTSTVNKLERTALGGLIENAVCIDLLGRSGGITPLSGWKKDKKHPIEVDFITKIKNGAVVPIEVKASLQAKHSHIKNLFAYAERHNPEKALLLSLDAYKEMGTHANTRFINVPAYALNEFLEN